jgi:hypothetical protein
MVWCRRRSGSKREIVLVRGWVGELVICFLGVHKEPTIITSWLKSACPGEREASSASSPSITYFLGLVLRNPCVCDVGSRTIMQCKLRALVRTSSYTRGRGRYGDDNQWGDMDNHCHWRAYEYNVKTRNSDPEGRSGITVVRLKHLWAYAIPWVGNLTEKSPVCSTESPARQFWFTSYSENNAINSIWGSHRGDYGAHYLLECNAV